MASRKTRPPAKFQYLVCTVPVMDVCKHCAMPVLRCLCHGAPTVLDLTHLSLLGEAMALVAGIPTYDVSVFDRKPFKRIVEMIERGLPEYGYIHGAHRCGIMWVDPAHRDQRKLFEATYTGMAPPF